MYLLGSCPSLTCIIHVRPDSVPSSLMYSKSTAPDEIMVYGIVHCICMDTTKKSIGTIEIP